MQVQYRQVFKAKLTDFDLNIYSEIRIRLPIDVIMDETYHWQIRTILLEGW